MEPNSVIPQIRERLFNSFNLLVQATLWYTHFDAIDLLLALRPLGRRDFDRHVLAIADNRQ